MELEIKYEDLQKSLLEQLNDYGNVVTGDSTVKQSQRPKKRKKQKVKELTQGDKAKQNTTNRQDEGLGFETKVKDSDRKTERPPPAVIVFEEPGKSQRNDQSEEKPGKRQQLKRKRKTKPSSDDEVDLRELAREVTEFGVTGFSRKDKRKFEQQKAQALGAKAPKGEKVPYPIMIYAAKVRKQRELEQQNMNKAMGIVTKKKQDKGKEKQSRVHGRWVDTLQEVDASVGKYKSGVQQLSRMDIQKIKKSGKKRRK